jgi:hypothetical protein
MVITMERVPSQPVKGPANLVRVCPFDLDRLLSHIDPGPAEESEAYVRLEQREVNPWRYLNVSPSAKALKKEREKLHEMTSRRHCFKPIPQLIEELNRHLEGWKNYFEFGYPTVAFGEINTYVRYRLRQHLRRRSQRPFRPPEGVRYYAQIQRLGLVRI